MKLRTTAKKLQEQGGKALVAFLTAGYPDEETFVQLVRAADAAGCDVIEIGVPFSDPIADGPLIQESSAHALGNGMSLHRSLELAASLNGTVTAPLVLMGYVNPILHMGVEPFAEEAARSGISGVIVPDVSFEESGEIRSVFKSHNIDYVDLIAPTSSEERIERIVGEADGFVYLVSVTGVTGVRSPDTRDIEVFVSRVRKKTNLPLYLGFGISDAVKARAAVQYSDGVIIGSALIRLIQSASSGADAVAKVTDFLKEVRSGVDAK